MGLLERLGLRGRSTDDIALDGDRQRLLESSDRGVRTRAFAADSCRLGYHYTGMLLPEFDESGHGPGATALPVKDPKRWHLVHSEINRIAERHVDRGPDGPIGPELGRTVRRVSTEARLPALQRDVSATPSYAQHLERTSAETVRQVRRTLMVGEVTERSLDRQAEILARDPDRAWKRLRGMNHVYTGAPLLDEGNEKAFRDSMARGPEVRVAVIRELLSHEAAMARAGHLPPEHIVTIATSPEAIASRPHDDVAYRGQRMVRPDYAAAAGRTLQERQAAISAERGMGVVPASECPKDLQPARSAMSSRIAAAAARGAQGVGG